MIIGMDFGTTNSGMAVYDGQEVQVLGIDPSNNNSRVARTALYITNDQQAFIGREAVDRYFDHNLGRPAKLERIWVGEIEVTVSDMTMMQDVYIWVDALSPGRLFLSIKTMLSDTDYLGTVIEPYFYSLEDLIALYLSVTRIRAEKILDQPLRRVVLGRPVKFNNDPQKDAIAQQRLIESALRAGYEEIYFQYEPIAAALHYEQTVERESNVLIFDFGGGTLDITVMRVGDPKNREVLSTGGVPIAGDAFDRKLIRGKLPKHFGEDTVYGPSDKPLTMPNWIHNTFSNWQTILQLQTPKNVQLLQGIARTARDPQGVNALIQLVSSNYGLTMFDSAEKSKRRLSRRNSTMILVDGPELNVREPVTRVEFEALINQEYRTISKKIDESLQESGLTADQIDAVIRTGGSSQIPLFETLLKEKFGPDKVGVSNVFSSVTSGLGITAHGIEYGEIEAEVYRAGADDFIQSDIARPNVTRVNLDIIRKQISLREGGEIEVETSEAPTSLALLSTTGTPVITPIPEAIQPAPFDEEATPTSLQPISLQTWDQTIENPPHISLPVNNDTILLWVTSHYRFVLMTAHQLNMMHEGGLTLAEVQRFLEREFVTTLSYWEPIKRASVFVVVTSQGIARRFQMQTLQSRIESPTPLKLDRPLAGHPVAVTGLQQDEEIIVMTQNGRAARVNSRQISVQGSQVISQGKGDLIIQATTVKPEDTLLFLTKDGYARRFKAEWLPVGTPKPKAISLTTRRPVQALAVEDSEKQLWAITNQRLVPINLEAIPLETAKSKKTFLSVQLMADEQVTGILTI
ncbi:MAG: Hsp70 family protein [Chloroflexota bacterium]